MALTPNDLLRLPTLNAKGLETITLASAGTVQYSGRVIPPGRLLRISIEDTTGGHVQLVNEYIFGNRFGFDPDVDANELFDGNRPGVDGDTLNQYYDLSDIVPTTPTLDKTAGVISQSHALTVSLVDQDDVFTAALVRGKRTRYGRASAHFDRAKIKAGTALTFRLTHLDDSASELLQWGLKQYRHADTNPVKWWDGSAWQTTIQWIDVTGSGSVATFQDLITTDEGLAVVDSDGTFLSGPSTYEVAIRPKVNYAAGFSTLSDIGVHETYAEASATRVQTNTPLYIETTHWCRVAVDTDNNSGKVYISELGVR